MKTKIKLSIIGCGKIFHKHLKAIKKNQNLFEIEAVCDPKIEKKKNFILSKKVKIFKKLKDLLANTSSDFYIILTPSGLHFQNILEVGKKFKNIIIEKPLVLNYSQGLRLKKFAKLKKLNLIVVKQNRYNSSVKLLKNAIENNKFGKIFLVSVRLRWRRDKNYFNSAKWRGTWKIDGGVLANQASHHLDLINWLLGDIKSVFTKTLNVNNFSTAPDTMISTMVFKNGAIGSLEITTATSPENIGDSISILGTKGSAEIGGYAVSKILYWNFLKKNKQDLKIQKQINMKSKHNSNGHFYFYKDVYNFFSGKKNEIIDLSEGLKVTKLIDKIYASAEKSQEVNIKDNFFSKKLGK